MTVAQEWSTAFSKHLAKTLNIPVVTTKSHFTPFPHIHIEWLAHREGLGRCSGEVIFSLATSMEEKEGDEAYAKQVRDMCASTIALASLQGVFKEMKIVRKTDAKVRHVSLHYAWFITRKD